MLSLAYVGSSGAAVAPPPAPDEGTTFHLFVGSARETDINHGAAAAANNLKLRPGNAGLEYSTGVFDAFGFEYRYTKGLFPQNYTLDNLPYNRDFNEVTGGPNTTANSSSGTTRRPAAMFP